METCLIEVRDGVGDPRLVRPRQFPFTVGRSSRNDLVVNDSLVSRVHATIERDEGRYLVVDRDSRNGILVNGERVESRGEIRSGDVLTIGPVELRLTLVDAPRVPTTGTEGQSVDFFPSPPSWDPAETLSHKVTALQTPPALRRRVDWNRLVEILVEPPGDDLYEKVIDLIEVATPFDRCLLILFPEGDPETLDVLARRSSATVGGADVLVSREILGRVTRSREAVIVTEGVGTFVPTESFIRSGAWSALCAPFLAGGMVHGVLYLERMVGGRRFTQSDVDILGPLAGLVALKLENRQLFEAYLASEIERRELEIATSVQQKYFPAGRVRLSGYSIDSCSRPSRQVGGDCVDLIPHDDGSLSLVIGDVSGKGLPSALYMVGVISTLRAHDDDGLELEVLMRKLDRYVRTRFRTDHFITLFVGRLDPVRGLLRYCSAGHMPAVIFSESGAVSELRTGDPALNIAPWEGAGAAERQLAPGDLLLVYTDGLTEAVRPDGEMFGRNRLLEFVQHHRTLAVTDLRERLLDHLRTFTGGAGCHDDVSLILVRREAGGAP